MIKLYMKISASLTNIATELIFFSFQRTFHDLKNKKRFSSLAFLVTKLGSNIDEKIAKYPSKFKYNDLYTLNC